MWSPDSPAGAETVRQPGGEEPARWERGAQPSRGTAARPPRRPQPGTSLLEPVRVSLWVAPCLSDAPLWMFLLQLLPLFLSPITPEPLQGPEQVV